MGRKTKMNSITSPELLAQVNPENTQLLEDFKDYLRSVQRSETTIAGYENDIQIAFVWCLQHNNNAFFVNWTKRNIVANPANKPVREKTVWEDEELDALLAKLVDRKDYEKACYLALAMYSGRRKSELCRFKISDFDEDKLVCGGALYKSDPIKTKGKGGGKMINCYTLAKKFNPYLDMWRNHRLNKYGDSEWLFPDAKNPSEHIQISTINSWSNTFSRLSGKPAYIHSLRHYFTTSLAKAGIPDGVIQSIVAWESSDMVQIYKDIDADEQIGMYFKDGDIVVPEKKGLEDL